MSASIASMVAIFQITVFTSFLNASVVALDRVGAHAWIISKGVKCFDFPVPLPEAYAYSVAGHFGRISLRRVAIGFVPWINGQGEGGAIAAVGVDGMRVAPDELAFDRTDLSRLGLDTRPSGLIGRHVFSKAPVELNLKTFLGSPYTFGRFIDLRSAVDLPIGSVSAIALNDLPPRANLRAISHSFGDIEVISNADFRIRSQVFWVVKTGAGASVLISSVLAVILQIILIMNGIQRFSQRRSQDLLTLLAVGLPQLQLKLIVGTMAAMVALASSALGLISLPVLVLATSSLTPWVSPSFIDVVAAIALALSGGLAGMSAAFAGVNEIGLAVVFRT